MNRRAGILAALNVIAFAWLATQHVNCRGVTYEGARPAAHAGAFYPAGTVAARDAAEGHLDPDVRAECDVRGLVLPHAGWEWSGDVAGAALAAVRGCSYQRVWVLGPAHFGQVVGIGMVDAPAWSTPLGDLPVDGRVTAKLASYPEFMAITHDDNEHSIEAVLPLLQSALGSFELVPLLIGAITPEQAQRAAARLVDEIGPGDLVVVSTDFTHHGADFGFTPFGAMTRTDRAKGLHDLDHQVWRAFASGSTDALLVELSETHASVCGRRGLVVVSHLMREPGIHAIESAYATSADDDPTATHSVSYLSGTLVGSDWPGRGPAVGVAALVSDTTLRWLQRRAAVAVEAHLQGGVADPPTDIPAGADGELGAFVSLYRDHALRGCVGDIEGAGRPVYQTLEAVGPQAAVDARFDGVTATEWDELTLELTLLGPPMRVSSAQDIIVGRHGVVLSLGPWRATLLPQVAPERGWDRHQLYDALLAKSGIPRWLSALAQLEVYEAQIAPPELARRLVRDAR